MNPRQKEVFQTHRNFIIKNIIWTEDFAGLLKTQGLVTDSILNDIRKHENRDERIKVLLDRLTMKAGQAYHKFCNVLQVTGHYFLADFLRDEENSDPPNVKDMLKKLPFLAKTLKDSERKMVESYVIEKMQTETLKFVWKKDAKDKDKALDAKLKQLETEVLMKEKGKMANEQISDLKGTLMTATEECAVLKAQINALKAEISALRTQHQEDLSKQVKFSMANENSLKRVTEKLEESEKALNKIRILVRDTASTRDQKSEKTTTMPENNVSYLMDDLNFLLSEFKSLCITERKYEDLVQERDWVLEQMGFTVTEDGSPNLTKAYKEFANQHERNIEDLRKEIDKYDEMLRVQTDKMSFIENVKDENERKTANSTAIWQAAIMSVMRRQLQDTKASNRKKDSNILFLEEEIRKLKDKLSRYENLLEEQKENNRRNLMNLSVGEDLENLRRPIPKDPQEKLYVKSLDSVNGGDASGESIISVKSETPRPKVNALPPLKYAVQKMNPGATVPRILKVRPQASIPRRYESRAFGGVPEGLFTSQLTLENRRNNNSVNGLSELKNVNRQRGSVNEFR
ncbi:uncharacterized protein LOC126832019 [Patella vulgata]|uniref:uncharacterized protein LOC126832019 n=1 Tax=Patella vulgata TaxID=6465 RepID=UPI00218018BD|nr:uncharacterized protein LOC126832019 [Patella vulgata]